MKKAPRQIFPVALSVGQSGQHAASGIIHLATHGFVSEAFCGVEQRSLPEELLPAARELVRANKEQLLAT